MFAQMTHKLQKIIIAHLLPFFVRQQLTKKQLLSFGTTGVCDMFILVNQPGWSQFVGANQEGSKDLAEGSLMTCPLILAATVTLATQS